jgi:glycosyltransferase involved in cell wall biosynthesis
LNIVHIITGLNDGGAEAVLYRLCKFGHGNQQLVISLTGIGKYGPLLNDLGVKVIALNMSSNRPSLFAFIFLVKILKEKKPNVVQTWMYHADLLGGLAARIAGINSVVWGIRHSTFEPGISKLSIIWIVKLLAILSRWIPAKIVVCAQKSIHVHESLGYNRHKMVFIPNGYDLGHFRPLLDTGLKYKLGFITDHSIPLIGMVARFDPQKDHLNLLDALEIMHRRGTPFQCILVGSGLDFSNEIIRKWISCRGLVDRVQLIGNRNDVVCIMNSLDLHILSSAYGEAFPNVVAESMACGTPCIVTDVGDAASIVGDSGWVVPPRDAFALAEAIVNALEETKDLNKIKERRMRARNRIEFNFSIELMVNKYSECWQSVFVSDNR